MNISEFAKLLNISTGTVSRALNDRAEVSKATRRLVLEKAQELGFTPNVNARRLVTGRSNLIQLECPYNKHILSDRYLVELARALEEAVGMHGYDLLLHLSTRRQMIGEVRAVDGLVIVAGTETKASDINQLTCGGQTPAVLILDAGPLEIPSVSCVRLNTLCGVQEAFHLLAVNGHRRVGYIGSAQPGLFPGALPGLMAEAGLTWDSRLSIEAGITSAEGAKAAARLLRLPDRPTALFARTDILAAAAIQSAQRLGFSVPGDISVIGHDNLEIAAMMDPPLTTVAINIHDVAVAAVDALLAVIGNKKPIAIQTLGTHLIIRKSVGLAPL